MKRWSDISLQTKLTLIFSGLGLLLFISTYFLVVGIVRPNFEKFELHNSSASLYRVRRALDGQLMSLKILNTEYSYWTVTYSAMSDSGLSPAYIDDNINIDYWPEVDTHMMLFYSANGTLQWGGLLDPEDDSQIPLEGEWFEQLTPDHPLARHHSAGSEAMGYMATPSGVMLVVSSPILTDEQSGPVNGSVVVGRILTPKLIADIAVATSVAVDVLPLFGSDDSGKLASLVEELSNAPEETTTEVHKDKTIDRMLIRDIKGKVIAILEVSIPRWISKIGEDAISHSMLLMVLAIFLFIVIASGLVRRLIVVPIEELKSHMKQVRLRSDQSFRFASPRKDEIGALAFEFDSLMSRLEEAYVQLEQSLERAEALSKNKGDFLATMSHEIRTSMNGVIGMTELLLTTELNEEQEHFAKSVMSSGNMLLNVINDILDFSKISAGKMQIESKPIVIAEVLAYTNDIMSEAARKKGIEYQYTYESAAGFTVMGDAFRIRQVVMNLAGNAIKFTEKGGVQLKVSCNAGDRDVPPGMARIRFSVSDTGIGISEEQKSIIFDSFSQSDSSMTRRYGGTGLGLSICRELVALMGGTLEVNSEFGKGAEFYFILDLPLAEAN